MDNGKKTLSQNKYKLPYHWIRDPLHKYSLPYFGYAEIILAELPNAQGEVFDAGCGDGRISFEIIRRGYTLTGIDFLEVPILYAKTLVPDGAFFVGDLRKNLQDSYGLVKNKFDAVVMVEVYEHIPPEDCPDVLVNVRGVLKPGGTLIISVPSKLLPPSKLHYRHFERSEFEQELQAAGFCIRKMVCQHRLNSFSNWLLGDRVENFLFNQWLQPVFLKRWRRRIYMRYLNFVGENMPCGRYIAIVEKQ